MLADFKIISVRNFDDGAQYIKFRFSEGAITTEADIGANFTAESVTRYRRSASLSVLGVARDSQLSHREIEALGRTELAKIADHDPIEEQKVV